MYSWWQLTRGGHRRKSNDESDNVKKNIKAFIFYHFRRELMDIHKFINWIAKGKKNHNDTFLNLSNEFNGLRLFAE